MAKLDKEELGLLIDKIRGSTPKTELHQEVEDMIKADEEAAKVKAEADKKKLEDIKAAEKKLKEGGKPDDPDTKSNRHDKRDGTGKFKKKEPETPEENEEEDEETSEIIEKLTEQMEQMAEEIKALKKRKNYRTPAPKGKDVDAKDLPDFIKQQTQNIENAEYETVV